MSSSPSLAPALALAAPLVDPPEASASADAADEAPLSLAPGLLGAVVFGAALGLGHGPRAMLAGAWAVPLLLGGGAALSLPPLYLCAAFSGGRASAASVARATLRALHAVSTALLGLAVPAAFFSVTLRTALAPALLWTTLAAAGGVGVLAVLSETFLAEAAPRTQRAGLLWAAFALLLGARLLGAVSAAATAAMPALGGG